MAKTRILLTGADGLTGSHILDQLLSQRSISVCAVVRSREAASNLLQLYSSFVPSFLELHVIAEHELRVPGVFNHILGNESSPFDAVIHTCLPTPFSKADCLTRYINLETETVLNFLRSIKRSARQVNRVVVVTTLAPFARWLAVPQDGRSTPIATTSRSFDPEQTLTTVQASDNVVHDAVLSWARDASPSFDIVWVTAPSIYGPVVRSLENSSDLLEANRRIWDLCFHEARERVVTQPYGIVQFLDVRVSCCISKELQKLTYQDFAFAIIRGLFTPQAAHKRFVVSAGNMLPDSEITNYLAARFPELRSSMRQSKSPPANRPSQEPPPGFLDTYLVGTVLGMSHYLSVEQTLADTAQQIVDLQRRKTWKSITQS